MDLNSYYQVIVRLCFPNAAIIIDRFHLLQMLNRSFNSLRVQTMKGFARISKAYRLLKSPWKLYLMQYDTLDKVHPHYNWHLKDRLTEEQVVLDGLDCNAQLKQAYWLVQDFSSALRQHDLSHLRQLIYTRQKVGAQMHTTLLTFKHNCQAVLNSARFAYSNGCLEGFNRKIKQIERTAFGYRNDDHLLARIQLEEKQIKIKAPSNKSIA